MRNLIQKVENEFSSRFRTNYLLLKSPGRVNLIGEHTDYNGGFVLPAAVGAGMSSSAALENAVVFGLNELFDLSINPVEMVKISQKAENQFVGVQC